MSDPTEGLQRGYRASFKCFDWVCSDDPPHRTERKDREPELGGCESYGSHERDDAGEYFIPELLSFSDYSGSIVERSNFRAFCQRFGDWAGVDDTEEPVPEFAVELYGEHGTCAIAIHVPSASEECWEFLRALEEYPLADEGLHSTMEVQAADEAWDSWVVSDYIAALGEEFPRWCLDDVDSASLRELFENAREAANVYWESETGGGMHVDLDRVVQETEEEQVSALPNVRRVSTCQDSAAADRALADALELAEQSRACATEARREELRAEARDEFREFVRYAQENEDYVPQLLGIPIPRPRICQK